MGLKNTRGAIAIAIVIGAVAPQTLLAKGSWQCGADDISKLERVEAERQATLSQRFYVTDEGRVEIVKIVIEGADRRPFWETLVAGVRERLGLGAKSNGATALAARRAAPARPQINTELRDWALSPLRPAKFELPDC